MNTLKNIITVVLITFCFSSVTKAQIIWDFEEGNNHGFTLSSLKHATPAADDPLTAGDESLTGGWEVGNPNNLPEAGVAWIAASPDSMWGQLPGADPDHARVNTSGELDYLLGTARIGEETTGSLNTYLLNMHGDFVHKDYNDQIATSPPVLLGDNAVLSVSSWGGGGTMGPVFDSNPDSGYVTGSCGIAVLKASDKSFLDSLFTNNKGTGGTDMKDLSAYAGQEVIIEVVDAFEGGWGWLAVDEIQITNATPVTAVEDKYSTFPVQFELAQNFPNPFNPSTLIQYTLGKNTNVKIAVYDLLGHKIATLVNEYQNTGSHKVVWDASGVSAGVYLYQMKVENQMFTKKMILVKQGEQCYTG